MRGTSLMTGESRLSRLLSGEGGRGSETVSPFRSFLVPFVFSSVRF